MAGGLGIARSGEGLLRAGWVLAWGAGHCSVADLRDRGCCVWRHGLAARGACSHGMRGWGRSRNLYFNRGDEPFVC